eukprot:11917876-Alexandrium_andersonii.AAC.1
MRHRPWLVRPLLQLWCDLHHLHGCNQHPTPLTPPHCSPPIAFATQALPRTSWPGLRASLPLPPP